MQEVKQMAINKDQKKNHKLDQEIAQYLPHLNVSQIKVVLVMVKTFVRS
jgi:hypothetical protein